ASSLNESPLFNIKEFNNGLTFPLNDKGVNGEANDPSKGFHGSSGVNDGCQGALSVAGVMVDLIDCQKSDDPSLLPSFRPIRTPSLDKVD
ncbi:hypothetical protein HAX54_033502, partial [Datura stramonium]|nr:hypothetical protein [Datura stramonium]